MGKIEILDRDLPPMQYYSARKACKKLGPGWRILGVDEFRFLQELHDLGVGGFQSSEVDETLYWTDNPGQEPGSYHTWDFSESTFSDYGLGVHAKALVRPCRRI